MKSALACWTAQALSVMHGGVEEKIVPNKISILAKIKSQDKYLVFFLDGEGDYSDKLRVISEGLYKDLRDMAPEDWGECKKMYDALMESWAFLDETLYTI